MKLLSQIGTYSQAKAAPSDTVRRIGRRVKWGYVAWFVVFAVTASLAWYFVHAMVHVMNRALSL